MVKFMYLLLILSSTLFLQSLHPIAMLMIILFTTMLVVISIVFSLQTSWLSYILFMVMLGGLLILFIYITTLTPNSKMIMINYYSILLFFLLIFSQKANSMKDNNMNYSSIDLLSIMKMFHPSLLLMTIAISIYLLISLFVIVYITQYNKGALRNMFYD
uniref:NADH dehydrogenase subunit 6 n=1 Tax=Anaulaciulus koreanus TaxID=1977246 RepID=A0A1X8VJ12_9MYRI|nr:NADH dehydrogenase subunit 6 [Anaulaciulus koreanus]ARF02895.1 NADH dehydrogenase subunit 6 [Anaulaciulus koreanus]